MKITTENYPKKKGIIEEYYLVRDFLIALKDTEYSFARWDWMVTHAMTEAKNMDKIRLWKVEDKIVGAVLFDMVPDLVFMRTLPSYDFLKKEMLEYAKNEFIVDSKIKIMIADDDYKLQGNVAKDGFIPTASKEYTSVFYPDETNTDYQLPEGITITSLDEYADIYQYYRLFWRGFNHELDGEGPYKHSEKKEKEGKAAIFRSNHESSHKIIAIDEVKNYVSFCGLWYDHRLDFAIVEPLATDPDYRKKGLAKAVIYEGINRVRKAGAKRIIVNTSKQFYYNRGFRPYRTQTVWTKSLK